MTNQLSVDAFNVKALVDNYYNVYLTPTPLTVKVPRMLEDGSVTYVNIENITKAKNSLMSGNMNNKGVTTGTNFFKSHSFEMRRVTNQGGTTLKSDSIFMTHAGEQSTLNSVIATLLKHRWKKTNIKDVSAEDNVLSADSEVIITPNNNKKDRTYSQMYRFIYNQFIAPGAINAMGYIRSKLHFIVYAKSPRYWLQDSKKRKAGILYVRDADATKSYDKRMVLAQYKAGGKGLDTYLELFDKKGRINGRDIVVKDEIASVAKDYTAKATQLVIVDARSAARKIYLPKSPKNGDKVRVKGRYSRGYVYVYGNGKKIEARDFTSLYGYGFREFTYYGEWLFTAKG